MSISEEPKKGGSANAILEPFSKYAEQQAAN